MSFTPLFLEKFEPFQVYNIDIDGFVESRHRFSTEEWIDLLVKSIGLNPSVYSPRQKLLLLFRVVPLVEGNVNLMELGRGLLLIPRKLSEDQTLLSTRAGARPRVG